MVEGTQRPRNRLRGTKKNRELINSLTNRTQVNTETGCKFTARGKIKCKTRHMSKELQNKIGNRRTSNSIHDNKKQFFGK